MIDSFSESHLAHFQVFVFDVAFCEKDVLVRQHEGFLGAFNKLQDLDLVFDVSDSLVVG
jgi:hypothetical protein